MTRKHTLLVSMMVLAACTCASTAATWYVDASAASGGDGTTPATAFTTIQTGIDAALDGDIVQLADGHYNTDGNHSLTLQGKTITISSQNGPENCVLNGGLNNPGFTIANDDSNTPVIEGIAFESCDFAIEIQSASAVIRNCTFLYNTTGDAYPLKGASLHATNSTLTVEECVFLSQHVPINAMNVNSTVSYRNCNFSGCQIPVRNESSTVTVVNTIFHDNNNDFGGGDYNGGGLCSVNSEVTAVNCLFYDNEAQSGANGGAVGNSGGIFKAVNCTFARNAAYWVDETYEGYGGAVYSMNDTQVFFYNSIFWMNHADRGRDDYYGGNVTIESSVRFNSPDDDPFFDSGNDNFRLMLNSICIDSGDDSYVPVGITHDLDGNPRFSGIVDQGAYEYIQSCGNDICDEDESSCTCPVDCGAPSLFEDDCFDNIDNDCDGLTDSEETDECGPCGNDVCSYYEDQCTCPDDCGTPPASETSCDDAFDNDCDGLPDSEDSDCWSCGNTICDPDESVCSCPADCGTPQAVETLCRDSIDNDCDGLSDFDDTDCHICGDGMCSASESVDSCPLDCDPSAVLFVDWNAPIAGDGLSWETAFRHPIEALYNAVPGQAIWVAEGKYSIPTGYTFDLVSGVSLYGGFAGTEIPGTFHLDDRDFSTNKSMINSKVYAINLDNSTVFDGFSLGCSALSVEQGSPRIQNCDFSAWAGGGLKCTNASPEFWNCDLSGGNDIFYEALGFWIIDSDVRIVNSRVHGFHRTYSNGAAFLIEGSTGSNVTLINTAVYNNSVGGHKDMGGYGGGIYISKGSLTLINSLMVNNEAWEWGNYQGPAYGGAIAADPVHGATIAIYNSIFWNNRATIAGNNIYGGTVSSSSSLMGSTDPQFADEENGNFYLKSSSQCINTGNNSYLPVDIDVDLDNNPRFTGIVDIGPLEYHVTPVCGNGVCDQGEDQCSCPGDCGQPALVESECSDGIDNDCDGDVDFYDEDCRVPGDADSDGDVDLADFSNFLQCFGSTEPECLATCDFDIDNDVDLDDFETFESYVTGPQ